MPYMTVWFVEKGGVAGFTLRLLPLLGHAPWGSTPKCCRPPAREAMSWWNAECIPSSASVSSGVSLGWPHHDSAPSLRLVWQQLSFSSGVSARENVCLHVRETSLKRLSRERVQLWYNKEFASGRSRPDVTLQRIWFLLPACSTELSKQLLSSK